MLGLEEGSSTFQLINIKLCATRTTIRLVGTIAECVLCTNIAKKISVFRGKECALIPEVQGCIFQLFQEFCNWGEERQIH